MSETITSRELEQVTGISRRVIDRYVAQGWVPPFKQGGGRGHSNAFDIAAAVWTIGLYEIFVWAPNANTPVWLLPYRHEETREMRLGKEPRTWKCTLRDGDRIISCLRNLFPVFTDVAAWTP